MPNRDEMALMAHLMRRAGFGATREELEARVAKGYEATVEELVNPEQLPPLDDDFYFRYFPGHEGSPALPMNQTNWIYRMINTKRPLEEKMALFWHQLFATGANKVDNPHEVTQQIKMFRKHGLGRFRDLLVELAKSPVMLYFLDNTATIKRLSTRTGAGSSWSSSL